MNSEGVNKWWNLILALKDGQVIEYRIQNGIGWGPWKECKSPGFSSNNRIQYRIKPKPVEMWVVIGHFPVGSPLIVSSCTTEAAAKAGQMQRMKERYDTNTIYTYQKLVVEAPAQ